MPLIAATAARYWDHQDWLNSPYRKYTPWALADAARVSLGNGTEFNRLQATEQDLLQILNAYSRFDDPFRRNHDLRAFMLRMAGEQMTWQVPEYQTIARTAAIFAQTPPLQPMECLLPGWDTEVFGCTLPDYVGTAQLALDEAILHRQVGGPAVTSQQLTALAQTATWPDVTLQVLPFTAGATAGMDGHFVILAFPDPEDPPVAYVEGLMGDVYVEAGEEVDRFTLAWTHLVTQALDPADSIVMISTLAKEN